MGSLSLLQMLWFPVLFITIVLTWLILTVRAAMVRRALARHSASVVVRLPDDSSIVKNDGRNLDN